MSLSHDGTLLVKTLDALLDIAIGHPVLWRLGMQSDIVFTVFAGVLFCGDIGVQLCEVPWHLFIDW